MDIRRYIYSYYFSYDMHYKDFETISLIYEIEKMQKNEKKKQIPLRGQRKKDKQQKTKRKKKWTAAEKSQLEKCLSTSVILCNIQYMYSEKFP